MPDTLRHRLLWHAIGAILVLFVIYQSLTPAPLEVEVGSGNQLGHFAAYATLMGWHAQLHAGRGRRLGIALAFAVMGIVLEWLQGLTGYRTMDAWDAVANACGVALGWAIAPPRGPRVLVIAERWLDRR